MSLQWPSKDKDEILDYSLDWTRALENGEIISSVSWSIIDSTGTKTAFNMGTTVEGLTNTAQTNTNTVATIYLSNGTNNKQYKLYCTIITSNSLTKERTVAIKIREYN